MDDSDATLRKRLVALADAAAGDQRPAPGASVLLGRVRSRSALPAGALAIAAIVLVGVVVGRGIGWAPGPLQGGGTTSPSSDATETAVASLPTRAPSPLPIGGISEASAVAIAQAQSSMVQTFVSARAGPFSELNEGIGPGAGIDPSRLVWAITLSGYAVVCPPVLTAPTAVPIWATCQPPRFGTMTYYIDYYTGVYLTSIGKFPPP